MPDRTSARPTVEEFASAHARPTLITAYLLTGEWSTAEEAAAEALVVGRRALGSDPAAGEHAVTVALARRHLRSAGGPWWSRDGGLHLQEPGAHPAAAVEDEGGLWEALSQLTELERAAIVLRGHAGMDNAAIAAALGRSPADVKRDLETGDHVVAEASRAVKADDRDITGRLAGFFAAHDALSPPTDRVVARALARQGQRRRIWFAAAAGGAAAAVIAAGVGLAALPSHDKDAASSGTSPTVLEDGRGSAPEVREPSLPHVGPGRKLVGFQTVIIAVPKSWVQVSTECGSVRRNAVVFPTTRGAHLCDDGTLPRGLSAVSFNRNIAGDPEVQGDFGPRRARGGEFLLTSPTRQGGRYVAYTSAPELGFGMSVTTRSRRTLERIMRSITALPANFTIVPEFTGLGGERLDEVVYGHRLVPERLYDANALVRTLEVVEQSRPIGAVVPTQTHVTLRMEPRFTGLPDLPGR